MPKPVANGLRTDHPVPGLPFVDDSHIPVDDPAAIEAVGRNKGEGMWGREDQCRPHGSGWVAFTTDPRRKDLGWCVRWHPEQGRSVLLFRDEDTSAMHMDLIGEQLLYRSGGYWWDGTRWYRPAQLWDPASERYLRRAVPAATTVTAADLLSGVTSLAAGDPLQVEAVAIDAPERPSWVEDLALWAAHRGPEDRPLSACVVKLSAPELTGDQLVGIGELADIAGIGGSTMRSYMARDEAEIPAPQAVINGRSVWSRPVAEEWAERRRDSVDGAAEAVMTRLHDSDLPPAQAASLELVHPRLLLPAMGVQHIPAPLGPALADQGRRPRGQPRPRLGRRRQPLQVRPPPQTILPWSWNTPSCTT